MIRLLFFHVLFISNFCCAENNNNPLSLKYLTQLLNHPNRLSTDHLRDDNRKPDLIMAFSQVTEGQNVLDLYAGGGWYTELFSLAVGKKGAVYAHNDPLTWRFGQKEMSKRTANHRLDNVIRLDKIDLSEINLPTASIDVAFMAINYHDLFFTHRIRNGKHETMRDTVVDHRSALKNIKRMLKKDGIVIIIDHSAHAGSGYSAANDLHRIDANIVKYQLDQAGFELLEEAFYLRNTNDDLNTLVFDPEIRGKTDRFIFKFGKKEAN